VKVGEQAADAELEDFHGTKVSLAKLWAKGPVLLVFYRGGWCPFCNFQVRSLARAYPDFQKRAVTPALIRVDRPSEAAKTQANYSITFPVLSDPDLVAHRAYRVLQEVDDATLAKYEEWGIDLEKSSGRSHHTIAIPSMFLIDETGVIRWAHADRDYKVRPTIEQLLSALDGVLKQG
jgi:peroxiredoxin